MLQGALENLASLVILYMRRLRSKEGRAGLGFLLSAMAERNEDNCLGKCCRLGIGGLVNILSESSFFFAYLVLHYLAPPLFVLLFFASYSSPNRKCSFSFRSQCPSLCLSRNQGLKTSRPSWHRGLALLRGSALRACAEWMDLYPASVWAW